MTPFGDCRKFELKKIPKIAQVSLQIFSGNLSSKAGIPKRMHKNRLICRTKAFRAPTLLDFMGTRRDEQMYYLLDSLDICPFFCVAFQQNLTCSS